MTPRYVIVSPVKDEEKYIELTLQSVMAQTVMPLMWVIVDDGSTDGTVPILERYARQHAFIRVINARAAGARQLGSAEAKAFGIGYASLEGIDYDFIVKLDGDLSFGPDYFEKLLARFDDDRRLGIASGVYLEMDAGGQWMPVSMPAYHAFGACKTVRRECFEQIGGFLTSPGWDTVDEIRAVTCGWTTKHFADLETKHHKREGSAMGAVPTSVFHGHIFYVTGGDPLFLLLKVLNRVSTRPYGVCALALAFGYLRSLVTRRQRLVDAAEARCYQRMLWGRFLRPLHTGPRG
jgi:glycosyltransferase involved in cell wall biosynthesis